MLYSSPADLAIGKTQLVRFVKHEKTMTHKIAVDLIVTLPRTTRDLGEMLSSAHAAEISKSLKHKLRYRDVQKTTIAFFHQHVTVYRMGRVDVGVVPTCGHGS